MCHCLHCHCCSICECVASDFFLFLSLRWSYVSVFLCFLCVNVSSIFGISCQCPAAIYHRAAHLSSHHSHSSEQRCLCHSVSHQSDCSQLRQSPSVLLSLYWPKLTAGGQVRATKGAWLQWVYPSPPYGPTEACQQPPRSLPHLTSAYVSPTCFPALPAAIPVTSSKACASVSFNTQVWLTLGCIGHSTSSSKRVRGSSHPQ